MRTKRAVDSTLGVLFLLTHPFVLNAPGVAVGEDANLLPRVSRYDRDAYLRAYNNTINTHSIDSLLKVEYQWLLEVPDDKLSHFDDDELSCRVYLAESSIPNAGLGVYTGVDLSHHESVGNPEIAILSIDIEQHTHGRAKKEALSNYPWRSRVIPTAQFLATGGCWPVIPGLGMLTNSHPGLVNSRINEDRHTLRNGVMDRIRDPGAGAVSDVYGILTEVDLSLLNLERRLLPKGSEFFFNYGAGWFKRREEAGMLPMVPMMEHFLEADQIVSRFLSHKSSNNWTPEEVENRWNETLTQVHDRSPRTRLALPEHTKDLVSSAQLGTARFSNPNATRPLEWLEENGQCMDHLRVGVSTIPQAGRGAFAMRSFEQGSIISLAPLLQIDREMLHMYAPSMDGAGITNETVGFQLVLNYCFGHPNSTLLLFPYSSTVQFINHHNDRPNVKVRWSTRLRDNGESLKLPLEDLKSSQYTKLMIEYVALKDIARGEEILLDYGHDWVEAWKEHVNNWSPPHNGRFYVLPDAWNGQPIVHTLKEQEDEPYPSDVRTACYYDKADLLKEEHRWEMKNAILNNNYLEACEILERRNVADGQHVYTVRVEVKARDSNASEHHVLTNVPRFAVVFVEQEYAGNEHLPGAFRHAIGMPEGTIPLQWLDLTSD